MTQVQLSSRDPSDEAPDDAAAQFVAAVTATPLVLVIDDDEGIRSALETVLRDEGYRCELAADGHQAVQMLDEGLVPDLIVLDLRMPVMTGWGVWDRLQVTPALSRVPVIVFTGTGLTQGAVGSATVLAKREVDRLLDTIAMLLRRQ